jgi:hypothetical protein
MELGLSRQNEWGKQMRHVLLSPMFKAAITVIDWSPHRRKRAALLVAVSLLEGCTSFGFKLDEGMPVTACVTPQPGIFATAVQHFSGRSAAMGFVDKLLSGAGKDGDLIITENGVRFVACRPGEPVRDVIVLPHADTELVYRDGNWLVLRSAPQGEGYRQYHAFALHGTTATRGETLARIGLAELRKFRSEKGLFVTPPAPIESNLAIVDKGDPEVRIASVDRSNIGKETGKGVAGGAAAGVAVGLNPQFPIILYPPAAAVLIVGGAVIGGTAGAVIGERAAQRNALMLPLEDTVISRTLHEMAMGPSLAKGIEPLMRIETEWKVKVENVDRLNCGESYRDCALRGILGVVEISPAVIEFRADKSDLLSDQDQAGQTLSVFQKVKLYSTLSGEVIENIDLIARSDRHSLAAWREKEGALLRSSMREAMQPMPDTVAMKLQRSLNKLLSFK